MKQVSCTRGFGIITDPKDGEEYNVAGDNTVLVSAEEAHRLKESYSGIVVADIDKTPTPEGDKDTFQCGVNDCSREVDSPKDTCWQHGSE